MATPTTPEEVRRVTCLLVDEGFRRNFAVEKFQGRPDFRGASDTERFISVSSASRIAFGNGDLAREFAGKFLPNMSPATLENGIGNAIHRAMEAEKNTDQRSAVIYSTLQWVALSKVETPLFKYRDIFAPYRVTSEKQGWDHTLGPWPWYLMPEHCKPLEWEVPSGCDRVKDFVMIRRTRIITHTDIYPSYEYKEYSVLFGFANLRMPEHNRWAFKGWFPAQMSGPITLRLGDSLVAIPHPGISCGWALPENECVFSDRRDIMASIHTYSFHPITGRLVCVAVDRGYVGMRLALASDICDAVGKGMKS